MEADPSWASVWPAAANPPTFTSDSTLVKGKRVAELGAGLGVAAYRCHLRREMRHAHRQEPLALHCAMSTAVVCGLPTGAVPTRARRVRWPTARTGVISALRSRPSVLLTQGLSGGRRARLRSPLRST